MKKSIFPSLIIAILTITAFTSLPDKIVGRWQQKMYDGSVLLAVFRADSTFEGFINGKTFSTGNYYMKKDTMFISDPSCNTAYYGTYTLNYFAADSVRFTVVKDTCMGRHEGMHNLRVGYVKPKSK